MIPDYCTQNNGDCPGCSLSNYGRDCQNHKIHTLGSVAKSLTEGNLLMTARLINDYGDMIPRLDELDPDPGVFIPRPALVNMYAGRATSRVRNLIAKILNE